MKVVLSIAGSDSSGGAGIQADLKTFEAFGVFGTTAITVLTAQNTTGVEEIMPIEPSFVKKQIEMVFQDFNVVAIKIGMLFNKEMVAKMIQPLDIPIVLDPVAISKAGSPLLQKEAMSAIHTLFEHVTLITPNQYEAFEFFEYKENDIKGLKNIKKCPSSILIKHYTLKLEEEYFSIDTLYTQDKKRIFQAPLIETSNLHGTGCSYSSAITANLALGYPLEKAISRAKKFITHALIKAPNIGNGPGPIHHKEGGAYVISA